jgi:hypothetical protein
MRGKVIDTITKGEIQKVINLLKESGRAIEIVEFQINAKTLEIDIFDEEEADKLRHHWLQSDKKKVSYPRITTNNLLIKSDTAAVRKYFEIFKCDDDYFWVESSDDDHFICDGIQGLLSMMADHFMPEENKSNS